MSYGGEMLNEKKWNPVLFDVDGTLVASGAVITECFQQTLVDLGVPLLSDEDLRRVIGPPLHVSLNLLAGIPVEEVDEAVRIFRTHYLPRYLEPQLYQGAAELVRELHAAGIPLATATTKPEPMAKELLAHLGIDQYFAVIAGASPDPDCTKDTVIADALQRLRDKGVPTSNPVLVGDRSFDVQGAEVNGISAIAAAWGYGDPAEFVSPSLVAVATDIDDLRQLLL